LIFNAISKIPCKERNGKSTNDEKNVLLTLMSLLESTREIELTFLVTPLCAATDELAVSGVERSFTKCLLSIAREVEVLDSRRETRSPGRGSSIFSRYTRERSSRFSWTLLSISFYVCSSSLFLHPTPTRYLFQQ